MRALVSRIATLLIVAVAGAGCGESGPSNVLTTLEVTPATATLFTVAPDNTVELTVVAKDQNGIVMAGSPTFASDAPTIATVGNTGTVSGVSAGTARINASLTVDGTSLTATTTVTVQAAPQSATVTAPQFDFTPDEIDVRAGGTVTWSMESVHHTVDFTTAGAPDDLPELQDASASRTFPTNGSFSYRCSIHPAMTGVVHVH